MQRLIAQGVLWALLAGMFAPLAPAALMPHACCLRHQHHCHMRHEAGISNHNCGHECCRFLAITTALFAPLAPAVEGSLNVSPLISAAAPASYPFHASAEHSGRAPPRES
jgi:hypothetical protein